MAKTATNMAKSAASRTEKSLEMKWNHIFHSYLNLMFVPVSLITKSVYSDILLQGAHCTGIGIQLPTFLFLIICVCNQPTLCKSTSIAPRVSSEIRADNVRQLSRNISDLRVDLTTHVIPAYEEAHGTCELDVGVDGLPDMADLPYPVNVLSMSDEDLLQLHHSYVLSYGAALDGLIADESSRTPLPIEYLPLLNLAMASMDLVIPNFEQTMVSYGLEVNSTWPLIEFWDDINDDIKTERNLWVLEQIEYYYDRQLAWAIFEIERRI